MSKYWKVKNDINLDELKSYMNDRWIEYASETILPDTRPRRLRLEMNLNGVLRVTYNKDILVTTTDLETAKIVYENFIDYLPKEPV